MAKKQNETQKWRAFLLRYRHKMKKGRIAREFTEIYTGAGEVICRRKRGHATYQECMQCQYHEGILGHCLYKETEPIDMRKWSTVRRFNGGICTAADRQELCRELHRVLLYKGMLRNVPEQSEEYARWAATTATEAAAKYTPYKVAATPDKDGYYHILNKETKAPTNLFAVYFDEARMWTAVEYLPPEDGAA